jgi:hypothetical protein
MKSIAEQYHETLAQARKVKPRSERKTILTERLRDLMRRQLRIESRKHRRAG